MNRYVRGRKRNQGRGRKSNRGRGGLRRPANRKIDSVHSANQYLDKIIHFTNRPEPEMNLQRFFTAEATMKCLQYKECHAKVFHILSSTCFEKALLQELFSGILLSIKDVVTDAKNHVPYFKKIGRVREFQEYLTVLQRIVERFPDSSFCVRMDKCKAAVKANRKFANDDAITKQVTDLSDIITRIEDGEEEDEEEIAEEDLNYLQKEIIPDIDDFLHEVPDVEENQTGSGYRSWHHLLSVQSELLREDFSRPLRKGVKIFISGKHDRNNTDVKVFRKARIEDVSVGENGYTFQISFDTPHKNYNWEYSKNFMHGSLLLLSHDRFQTPPVWATVDDADSEKMQNRSRPSITISIFKNEISLEDILHDDREYVLIESGAFFTPYERVISGLKKMGQMIEDGEEFPFGDHFIHLKRDISPPTYLTNLTRYKMENVFPSEKTVRVLGEWPASPLLDPSQLDALRQILTKSLAIVQGPPGTGKTYVARKAIEILLKNNPGKTILVVAITNHALDQLLEAIIEFETNVVRIGGRSRCETLDDYNLKKRRYAANDWQARKAIKGLAIKEKGKQIEAVFKALKCEDESRILQLMQKYGVISHEQMSGLKIREEDGFQIQGDDSCLLRMWLFQEAFERRQYAKRFLEEQSLEASAHQNPFMLLYPDYEAQMKQQQMQAQQDIALFDSLIENRNLHEVDDTLPMPASFYVTKEDLWAIPERERLLVYNLWLEQLRKKLFERLGILTEEYKRASARKQEILQVSDAKILGGARVIGITTTGAARMQNLMHYVKPEIVIAEEAAEVVEGHLLTCVSPSTEHIVLIGDHKQLRPSCADYFIERRKKLEISLFERMMLAKVDFRVLSTQRRMRPEISLLSKMHYSEVAITDHETTHDRENILGVSKDVQLFHHDALETKEADTNGRLNKKEAELVTRFAKYLVQQGYDPERITILTPYMGQHRAIKRCFRKMGMMHEKSEYNGMIHRVIDKYQGEENDIIVLSLVRSNREGNMGFLKIDNRMCVALSRARLGLYVFGNFEMLNEGNQTWRKIIAEAKRHDLYSNQLRLCCRNHPKEFTDVTCARDFDNCADGGCKKMCNARMPCGHTCPRYCHPTDQDHELGVTRCQKRCVKKFECGHQCMNKCFQCRPDGCPPCRTMVLKVCPCSHENRMKCSQDPLAFDCKKKLEKEFTCLHGHTSTVQYMCYRGPPTEHICQEKVHVKFPCGHSRMVSCHEQSEVKCLRKCPHKLECGHKCPNRCYQCVEGHAECAEECVKTLVCGHRCDQKHPCTGACGPCEKKCKNRCAHNHCNHKCGEACVPCVEKCEWNCAHFKCTKLCSFPCDRPRCHECCLEIRGCGHNCVGVCGEPCPRICPICTPNKTVMDEVCMQKKASDISVGKELYVQLPDCGHIFDVNFLDKYFDTTVKGKNTITLPKCPSCQVPIQKCTRYGSIINQILQDLEAVKLKIRVQNEKVDVKEVVSAINLGAGHWYKCPNGHIYVIGECGQAMQEGKCPDCGSTIGGGSHRLREDNEKAEMESFI